MSTVHLYTIESATHKKQYIFNGALYLIHWNGTQKELIFSLPSMIPSDVERYFINNTHFTPSKSKPEEIIREYLAFTHQIPVSKVNHVTFQ